MKYDNVKVSFIKLGMFHEAVLHEPVIRNEKSSVCVICFHSDGNYMNFPACNTLAGKGYLVIAGQVSRQEATLDDKLLDIKGAIEYAKEKLGAKKVIILGHSGGATLMSCYQAVAENGCELYQTGRVIYPMKKLPPLPAADGFLCIDSNFGNGVMTAVSVDPAVMDESSGVKLNPEYDVFNPANGFDPAGSRYTAEFKKKYLAAQAKRVNAIIDRCLERVKALDAHQGNYFDDEPFIVPGAAVMAPNNKLIPQDMSLIAHTEEEYDLIHADGSVTKQIVYSVRKPRGDRSPTPIYGMGAAKGTARHYITGDAVRLTDEYDITETGIKGVDWDSSYCCTPGNAKHITCPTLIMGMTAGYEYLAAEQIYRFCPAEDKEICFVEGATHMITPAGPEYGDTVELTFARVDKWLEERFI